MQVLVVEDDPGMRSLLERALADAGFGCESCDRGAAALELLLNHQYVAVLLDLCLPDIDGLAVLEWLRRGERTTPVLVLSARGEIEDRIGGLDSGADDYLVKPFAVAEMLARLRALIRRGTAHESTSIEVGDLKIDLMQRKVYRGGELIELTPKEFALLEFLARRSGQVVTRTMIAEAVWDIHFDCQTNVIDVYIRYLRRKVDEPFDQKLIHTRRGVGYMLSTNAT